MGTGRAQKRVAKEILHNEPECGITKHRQFAKRIIGGHKARFAELPWQVREPDDASLVRSPNFFPSLKISHVCRQDFTTLAAPVQW